MKKLRKGSYILSIRNTDHYSMDGCQNGDSVVVKGPVEDEADSSWVDVTRQDGTVSVDFLVSDNDIQRVGG